jgi:hypothetical protein
MHGDSGAVAIDGVVDGESGCSFVRFAFYRISRNRRRCDRRRSGARKGGRAALRRRRRGPNASRVPGPTIASGRAGLVRVVENWRGGRSAPYGDGVGRAAKKSESGTSGRLAASRRGAWNERKDSGPPSRGAGRGAGRSAGRASGGKGRGKASSSSPSLVLRFFKFCVLLVVMAVLGFSVVLVADVGLTVVGGMKFGQITFAELVDKIENRFFDRDVPLPKPKADKKVVATKPSAAPSTPAAPAAERAPVEAPRPDEYARHLEPRPDPEVEAARDRLNDLLKKL